MHEYIKKTQINFILLTCYCTILDISSYFPVYWWKPHTFFSSISLVVEVVVIIVANKNRYKASNSLTEPDVAIRPDQINLLLHRFFAMRW